MCTRFSLTRDGWEEGGELFDVGDFYVLFSSVWKLFFWPPLRSHLTFSASFCSIIADFALSSFREVPSLVVGWRDSELDLTEREKCRAVVMLKWIIALF